MRLEAAAAAEIFKVSVVIFIQDTVHVLNRNGTKGTTFLDTGWRCSGDMPEKVAAATNVPALSSKQREQIDKRQHQGHEGRQADRGEEE